jgi:hypothetical protein
MTKEQLGELARLVLASAELSKTSGVDGVITVNADLLFEYLAEQGNARRAEKNQAKAG